MKKMWLKSVWQDSVVSSIVVAIILALSNKYLIKIIPVLSFLQKKINIPVWIIIITSLIIVLLIYKLFKNTRKISFQQFYNGVIDFTDNTKCEYQFDIIGDRLVNYKIRCKDCGQLMDLKDSSYFRGAGPKLTFHCSSCNKITPLSHNSQDALFKDIEKKAERELYLKKGKSK